MSGIEVVILVVIGVCILLGVASHFHIIGVNKGVIEAMLSKPQPTVTQGVVTQPVGPIGAAPSPPPPAADTGTAVLKPLPLPSNLVPTPAGPLSPVIIALLGGVPTGNGDPSALAPSYVSVDRNSFNIGAPGDWRYIPAAGGLFSLGPLDPAVNKQVIVRVADGDGSMRIVVTDPNGAVCVQMSNAVVIGPSDITVGPAGQCLAQLTVPGIYKAAVVPLHPTGHETVSYALL